MIEFKKDKYTHARGNYSRALELYCRKCHKLIAIYQKDGGGQLLRLYLDRIIYPKELVAF